MMPVALAIYVPIFLGAVAAFLPGRFFKVGGVLAAVSAVSAIAGAVRGFPEYVCPSGLFAGGLFSLVLVFLAGLFSLLVALYSIEYLKEGYPVFYWSLFCWMTASASGVFLSAHMFPFLISWGISGVVLSLLIWQAGCVDIGKKTLIIVGGSDAFLVLGLMGLYVIGSGSFLFSGISSDLGGPFRWVIFLSLLVAAFAKAGAMPFHTWIPDTARDAPAPVAAILPACVDKLVGIYLLKLIVTDWFNVSAGGNTVLMATGSITIIAAVFMALSQHNLRRLLGYHAVSQVGYMVIGLGTGNALGIAGGLLHMINNSIYKQGLFLAGSVVEKKAGSAMLEKLGGLFKNFPVTFASFTIMAVAISGLPPLNGFVSKWIVYHGIVSSQPSGLWIIWFTAALFGSVLTLASFVKITHAAFLGQPSSGTVTAREKLGWEIPALVLLPLMCILIGVFPQYTVYPILEIAVPGFAAPALWQPSIAAGLMTAGVALVLLIYLMTGVKNMRKSGPYIGGEKLTPQMRVSGVQFYTTIENIGIFKKMYGWAERKFFDIYEVLKGFIFYLIKILRWAHSGVLSVYLIWMLAGSVVVFYILLLK